MVRYAVWRTRGHTRRSRATSTVPRLSLKRVAEEQLAALPDRVREDIESALVIVDALKTRGRA
jgi:hypothetical protein